MKYLGWLLALFVIAAGAIGVAAPDRVIGLRALAATSLGLMAIAVLSTTMSVVLIMSAPASRAPKVLQACGAVLLLIGMGAPLFGIDRTRVVVNFATAQGPSLMRAGAAVIVAIGGFLAFALSGQTPAA